MDSTADPILIVGAGFAGLAVGIRLLQANIHDFTILEREDEIGGTWRDNRYPGAGCDVESHLYSFSFEPNPDWSRAFAGQREIQAYLLHCAEKYRLRPHIRFRTAVVRSHFDERTGLHTVVTDRGETLRARALVLCCGGLSRPAFPDIAGLKSFEGPVFHSSQWNSDASIDGASVAVIGTGASAIQIVPAIAPRVSRLDVYQRTPPWILPKVDRPVGAFARHLFRRFPAFQCLARSGIYWFREVQAVGFVLEPNMLKVAEHLSRKYLKRSVADPVLRAKLSPNYRLGCKRVLPTSDYYPAICRPNVDLVTDPIREIRTRSIVTQDGTERSTDVLVLSTGFVASERVAPFEIRGSDGSRLDVLWKDGAEAYLGTTVAGFPNLFFVVGPNTGLGHSSMILMIESQVQYILSCIQTMRAQGLKFVDVTREAQATYNAHLQSRLRKTVWATGCSSWYLTPSRKNTTLWPGFTFEFRCRTRRFDLHHYRVQPKDDGPTVRSLPSDGVASNAS